MNNHVSETMSTPCARDDVMELDQVGLCRFGQLLHLRAKFIKLLLDLRHARVLTHNHISQPQF